MDVRVPILHKGGEEGLKSDEAWRPTKSMASWHLQSERGRVGRALALDVSLFKEGRA